MDGRKGYSIEWDAGALSACQPENANVEMQMSVEGGGSARRKM